MAVAVSTVGHSEWSVQLRGRRRPEQMAVSLCLLGCMDVSQLPSGWVSVKWGSQPGSVLPTWSTQPAGTPLCQLED